MVKIKDTLTQHGLKEMLNNDIETGVFTRKVRTANRVQVGDIAGHVTNEGYIRITLEGKRYLAHRLAWLYYYGKWPKGQIHHVNHDKTDNRITNLRDVTNRENCSNKRIHGDGHLVGTTFKTNIQKWVAQIYSKGRHTYLGLFDTQLEAHEAYLKAVEVLL